MIFTSICIYHSDLILLRTPEDFLLTLHVENVFHLCICSNHDEIIICKLSTSRILWVRTKTLVWAEEHPTLTTC